MGTKQELQALAFKYSGVTFEESERVLKLQPSLYERMGKEEGLYELSRRFYDRVFDDHDVQFTSIFASSTKEEAIDNQYRFFVQIFGGPDLYRQKKGKYTRLVGRHANYNIGHQAADRWVEHMIVAVSEHDRWILQQGDKERKQEGVALDANVREALIQYFRYTAHYIVSASVYMRPDQLSGGTKVDAGRLW